MINKNVPFFGFKDDQDSESDKEDYVAVGKQEIVEEGSVHSGNVKKQVNVKSAVMDDEKQSNQQSQQLEGREDNENPKESEKKDVETGINKKKPKKSITNRLSTMFFIIFFSILINIIFLYPMIIIGGLVLTLKCLLTFCCYKLELEREVIRPVILFIVSSSIMTVVVEAVVNIFQEKDMFSLWYIDNFFLFLSHIMIFTIVQMTKKDNYDLNCTNVCAICDPNNTYVLVLHSKKYENDCNTIIDIPVDEQQWEKEYLRIMGDTFEVDLNSQRFNTFITKIKHPNIYQYIGYQLIQGQSQYLRPHLGQFITLMVISGLKILSCILFLYNHNQLGWYDIINVTVITIFTINEVYCLNVILSNYDLRRKTIMNKKINEALLVSGSLIDYNKVIDITNNDSIETWDNSRRSVYLFFSDMQAKLERSYVCLLLYYIFITCIILAAYGEVYLVIQKESILLKPLIVISSTFTFIFLNALIFFRLYFGSQYNQTIEDQEDTIDSIIGIYSDLIQMFDFNFTQKGITKNDYLDNVESVNSEQGEENQKEDQKEESQKEGQKEEDEKSKKLENDNDTESKQKDKNMCYAQLEQEDKYTTCYDILISKFMYLSDYYITKGVEFQGKIYTKNKEKALQQNMMQNCLQSFKRIKSQIIVDNKLQCYQAFNIMKLDFKDTLFTISLGLLTLLPQIITKFIEQFENVESQPT